ncbi:hypothetical protein KY363_05330, partial [Candidatus Woesearchaeota archaeon]|nr:hypothetical protein [Candidatus Woesearchaeota archaeon]
MFFGLKRILNSKLLKYLALSLGIHAGTGYIVTRDWEDPLFVTVAAAKKSPEENDDPAVTLEQLLEQRKRFNEKLYKHVRTGELVGMSYHEMAVQRDVLAHNIDAMRRGFPFLLDSSQLIGRFEQFAESISPDVHSAKGLADKVDEIQFQLFERGMFLGYQGKEARTSSILERGMYNCDSSTEFAIMAARYLGIDQQKLLVYEDHLASVVPDDRIRGRMWKVEHTATHGFRQDYARAKQGMIAPVSLFAIGYLLKQGYSLSQFPENIQQYYREKLGSESISTLINKLVGTNTTKAFPSPGVVSGLAPPDPDEIIYMKPMRSGGALADGIGSGDGRFIGQSGNRPVAVARSGAEHVPETAEQKPKSLDSVLGLLDEKRIPSSLLQAVKSTGFYRFLKSHNNDYESRLPKKLLYELAGWSGLSIKGYGQDGMVLLSPDDVRVEQIILKVLQGKVSEAYFGARLK